MSRRRFDRADLAVIAAGGLAGATVRWLVTRTGEPAADWFEYAPTTSVGAVRLDVGALIPERTLVVNIVGCLLLGVLTVLLTKPSPVPRRALVGAATGFCGSLTTFSGLAVEVALLLRNRALSAPALAPGTQVEPTWGTALLYLALTLIGGFSAFAAGRIATQSITSASPTSTTG